MKKQSFKKLLLKKKSISKFASNTIIGGHDQTKGNDAQTCEGTCEGDSDCCSINLPPIIRRRKTNYKL